MSKMTIRELIQVPAPNRLLTVIEQQERYVAMQQASPAPCPVCATEQSQFKAYGVNVDEPLPPYKADEPVACTNASCPAILLPVVPLVVLGPIKWHWMVVGTKSGTAVQP